MDRLKQIEELNQFLLEEMPRYREQAAQFPHTVSEQRRLLRSLMNLRPPMPLDPAFLRPQDKLLSTEREEKGVVDGDRLPGTPSDQRLALWQGDITRLKVDAIVDAGNSALLGCFCPCHGCIDNAIHSAAGLQLRDECGYIMKAQGHPEPAGRAKLTEGYNLPARYVLHTVGPVVGGTWPEKRGLLLRLYRRVPLPAQRCCGDRGGGSKGVPGNTVPGEKGDLQCLSGLGRKDLPGSALTCVLGKPGDGGGPAFLMAAHRPKSLHAGLKVGAQTSPGLKGEAARHTRVCRAASPQPKKAASCARFRGGRQSSPFGPAGFRGIPGPEKSRWCPR